MKNVPESRDDDAITTTATLPTVQCKWEYINLLVVKYTATSPHTGQLTGENIKNSLFNGFMTLLL